MTSPPQPRNQGTMHGPEIVDCHTCGGVGLRGCPACRRSGLVYDDADDEDYYSTGGRGCDLCGGCGDVPCPTCDGTGYLDCATRSEQLLAEVAT